MKRILSLMALACLTATLTAQDDESGGAAAEPDQVIVASLTPSTEVLTAGASFTVTLTVEFNQAAKVPATLFGGHSIQTSLDDEESVMLERIVDGEVEVAADTRLERTVAVDAAALWEQAELEEHSVLGLEWTGLPGATATLRLVPDQTDLDVSQLDLAQTKVKLVTSKGDMLLSFRPDKAPNHVENFIELAKSGFYNGTRFHRIIRGFMIQGGDPHTKRGATGTPGTGGPGYTVDAEFNDIKHVRGVLSMARSRDPNSAGSQFFLMHGKAPALDGNYTAFGQVESGLDVLDAIADTPVRQHPRSGEASVPVEDVWLYAAIVEPVFKE